MWQVWDCTHGTGGIPVSPLLISEERCREWIQTHGEGGRVYDCRYRPVVELIK